MLSDLNTARTLYKKLLACYPQGFREQLAESMEQTFNDLCNERKQQPGRGWFGFVLWMFVETAIGIVQEHILLIREMNPMKNTLITLRLSAIISFLIILPFMLIEFIFVIIKRLNFDFRDALDSTVIFGFLWVGLAVIIFILMPIAQTLRAGITSPAQPVLTQGNALTNLLTNPTSAAILGFILALPFLTILSFMLLHIEPPLGPLEPLLNNRNPDQPNVLGTLIVLVAFLLAVLAGVVVRAPIVRMMRTGGSLLVHPVNLMLVVVVLSFIAMFVVGLTVDQFPCWLGVPNCD